MDAVEAGMAAVYRKHPKWRAREVRQEIDHILHASCPELPRGWPGLSAVQKVLATIRRPLPPDPLDKPWSTATLDSYPIPPEALSVVLMVWKSCIEKGQGFTIREAKWTARLSAVGQDTKLGQDIERLFFYASRHARAELMFELIGRPFDSTGLDRSLMGLPVGISNYESFLCLLADPENEVLFAKTGGDSENSQT